MSYLDLVENYPREYKMTQFEKVLVAVRRAKDLHTGKAAQLLPSDHKHPYMALEEIKEESIGLLYLEEEIEALPAETDGSGTDEEE